MNSSILCHEILGRISDELRSACTDQEAEINEDELIDLPWEDNSFQTLEADCPWSYEDNGFNGWQSVQEYRVHCPYRTMRFRNILAAGPEVYRVMKEGSHAYLWFTKDFMLEAMLTLKAWGYTFKNAIIWLKSSQRGALTYGMGHWYRNGWEGMLFGVRGKAKRPAQATSQPNWFVAPKPPAFLLPDGKGGWTKHSRKPQEAYDLICRNSPGPRVSLFQRGSRDGFYCWGDEAEEGLQKEWSGEQVSFDDQLSFGVDYDAGDVSILFNSEELDELRTAIEFVRDSLKAMPESLNAIDYKLAAANEVLLANYETITSIDMAAQLNGNSETIEIEAEPEEPTEEVDLQAEILAKWKLEMDPEDYARNLAEMKAKGYVDEDTE